MPVVQRNTGCRRLSGRCCGEYTLLPLRVGERRSDAHRKRCRVLLRYYTGLRNHRLHHQRKLMSAGCNRIHWLLQGTARLHVLQPRIRILSRGSRECNYDERILLCRLGIRWLATTSYIIHSYQLRSCYPGRLVLNRLLVGRMKSCLYSSRLQHRCTGLQ
jgi:hypothetical protein